MKFKNVLVYSEDQQILLQLLNKGDELASKLHGELVVQQIGYELNGVKQISKYGA